MASWDVFHADSLELERGLSGEAVRAAMAGGRLRDDDLVRPAGTTAAWARLGDFPELAAAVEPPAPIVAVEPAAPAAVPTREADRRAEPMASAAEPPGRIRAERVAAPPARPAPSDFELRADFLEPAPQPNLPTPPTSIAATPAWIELGGESDDVTFPVIPGRPEDRMASESSSTRPGPEPGPGPPPPAAWDWPDDDEDEEAAGEEDEVGVADLDEQLEILDDEEGLEILDEDGLGVPSPLSREATSGNGTSRFGLPVVPSRDWNEDRHPVEDGEEEEDFTLSRGGPMTVEELDLAPMVDVAFQLVLFFMVTATTVLYKTLEIPKPTTDQTPKAVAQGHSRTVDDLQKDYILVEIDSGGAIKIDREPVASDVDAMAERLRIAREKTGRKIMLLSADYATAHRNAVLAYDAAIEIGMGIAIARPNAPQGPAPSVFPGAGKGSGTRPAGVEASQTRPATSPAPPSGGSPF